jgi:LacI family transcriptional regulator
LSAKLSDVARLAEVSTATVSRVLNKSGYVSKKAREKVLSAIKELEYKPSKVASYLAAESLTSTSASSLAENCLRFFPQI